MTIRYHQQDTDCYCGPATVLMLVDTAGTGRNLPHQDVLAYQMGVNSDPNFYTSPSQMVAALDANVAPIIGRRFVLNNDACFADAMRRVLQCLTGRDGIGAVVAWDDGNHWIIATDVNAAAGADGLSPHCFFINSPVQLPIGAQMPPPHTRGDSCGQPQKGVPNFAVSFDYWVQMFTPANHGYAYVTATSALPGNIQNFVPPRRPWFSTQGMTALQAATGAIDAHELATRGPQAAAMARVTGIGEPSAVLDLRLSSRRGEAVTFTTIPLKSGDVVVGILSLDDTGSFMTSAYAYDGPAGIISESEAREIAIAFSLTALEASGDTPPPVDTTFVQELVWRPSTASPFPAVPFYRSAPHGSEVYVRVDGAPFHRLPPFGKREKHTGSHSIE